MGLCAHVSHGPRRSLCCVLRALKVRGLRGNSPEMAALAQRPIVRQMHPRAGSQAARWTALRFFPRLIGPGWSGAAVATAHAECLPPQTGGAMAYRLLRGSRPAIWRDQVRPNPQSLAEATLGWHRTPCLAIWPRPGRG